MNSPDSSSESEFEETPPFPPRKSELPFESIGDYRILRKLDRQGGMSIVFEAFHSGTNRRVAIKVLNTTLSLPNQAFDYAEPESRFHREIEIASRLEHPHIARVYDGNVGGQIPFIAMEFVEGLPLDEYITTAGLGTAGILRLVILVCRAIGFANSQGVIHRDLKPTNILVKDGEPKVLDFGLAKALAEATESGTFTDLTLRSMDGQRLGTPAFMSPEQARGENRGLDIRTDVYSLGAILYIVLTGKYPHEPGYELEPYLRRIGEDEAAPPETNIKGKRLNRELRAILTKAVSFDRARRYNSSEDLARDLERFLAREPIQAGLVTPFYPLRKHLRRHWMAYSSLAFVMTLFLIAGAAWVVQTKSFAMKMGESADLQFSLRGEADDARKRAETALGTAEEQRIRAENETKIAEDERRTANQAASSTSFRLSRRFADEGDRPRMFAHLASAIRRDPSNRTARAAAVMALLQDRSLIEAHRFRMKGPIPVAEFSPEGKWLLLAGNGVAQIRSVADGQLAQRIEYDGTGHRGGFLGGCTEDRPAAMVVVGVPRAAQGFHTELNCFGPGWKMEPARVQEICRSLTMDRKAPRILVTTNKPGWEIFFSGWELSTEKKPLLLFEQHVGQGKDYFMIGGSQFHPVKDGVLFAGWGGARNDILFFDLNRRVVEPSGIQIGASPLYMTGSTLSHSGKLFGACGTNGKVSIWKVAGPELVGHFNHEGRSGHSTDGVAISRDDRYASAGVRCGHAVVWDLETGKELVQLKHDTYPYYTEFSPDGQLLLTRSASGEVYLWDWRAEKMVVPPFRHGKEGVRSTRFCPDGRHILTVSDGDENGLRDARIWKTQVREIKPVEFDLGRPIESLAITPDGKSILAGSTKGPSAIIMSIAHPDEPTILDHLPLKTRPYGWYPPAADPGGEYFTVAKDEYTLAIHRFDDPAKPVCELRNRHPITAVRFSPVTGMLATGDRRNQVSLWKIEGDEVREVNRFSMRSEGKIDDEPTYGTYVIGIAFSPDGSRVAASNYGKSWVMVWKADQASPAPEGQYEHSDAVAGLEFSADGQWLGTGTFHNTVMVAKLEPPKRSMGQHHGDRVFSVKFIPGQQRFISVSEDRTIRFWRYGPGFLDLDVPPFTLESSVTRLIVSQDGFLAGTASGVNLDLWDLQHTERFAKSLQHPGPVQQILFHPTESSVVTACSDGKVRFWPIASGAGTAPDWFPDFLEGIGGQSLNAKNELESLSAEREDSLLEEAINRVRQVGSGVRDDYLVAAARYLGEGGEIRGAASRSPHAVNAAAAYQVEAALPVKNAAEFSEWLQTVQLRLPVWVMNVQEDHAIVAWNEGHFEKWKIGKIVPESRSIHFAEPQRIFEIDPDYRTFQRIMPNGEVARGFSIQPRDPKIFEAARPVKNTAEFNKWLQTVQFRLPEWVMKIQGDHAIVALSEGRFEKWKIEKIVPESRSIHFAESQRIFEIDPDYRTFQKIIPDGQVARGLAIQPLDPKIFEAAPRAKNADEFSEWLQTVQLSLPNWVMKFQCDHAVVVRTDGLVHNWKIGKIVTETRSIHFSKPERILELDLNYHTFRMISPDGTVDQGFPIVPLDPKIFEAVPKEDPGLQPVK